MILEDHNYPFDYNHINNTTLDLEENENIQDTKKNNIILNEELLPGYHRSPQLSITPDEFISLKNE